MRRIRRRHFITLAIVGLCAAIALPLACDRWVASTASGRLFTHTHAIERRDVALILGTSPSTNGRPNRFFTARIRAAADLYHAGKVRHLIVSGDNHTKDYDEPSAMRDALVACGVPADALTLDYAGFRTLDSVVRARDVFGQTRITVVSQAFHAERAIFIASSRGIDAVAYVAPGPGGRAALSVRARETLARTLAVLDTRILNTRPHFPGPPEPIALAK